MTQALNLLLGRILISAIFILAGFNKIGGYEGTAAYMDSMGVPGMLLPLVILLELGGGLAILAGWKTRIISYLLAGFCILAAVIFHPNISEKMEFILFMKNFAIAGGFLILASHGAGAWSVDARLGNR
ncbi:MAG: DoxX family protein [bacterium]